MQFTRARYNVCIEVILTWVSR